AEVQTFKDVIADFPSEGSVAEVVVRAPAADQGAVEAQLAELGRAAAGTGMSRAPSDPGEVSAARRTTVLDLAMPFDESDARIDDALTRLRDLAPATVD